PPPPPELSTPSLHDALPIFSWRDPKVSLLDLQYHDIRPDRGIYYRLVQRGGVERITDDESIERAKHVPPQTTRARLRGAAPGGRDRKSTRLNSSHDQISYAV